MVDDFQIDGWMVSGWMTGWMLDGWSLDGWMLIRWMPGWMDDVFGSLSCHRLVCASVGRLSYSVFPVSVSVCLHICSAFLWGLLLTQSSAQSRSDTDRTPPPPPGPQARRWFSLAVSAGLCWIPCLPGQGETQLSGFRCDAKL